MERIYGLTFEGTDDYVENGTGLDIEKLRHFLEGTAHNWKLPLTIRLVGFHKVPASAYLDAAKLIKRAGHRVMFEACDSEDMRHYTPESYRSLQQKAVETLGSVVDIFEVANEVSGSRGDKKWPGPDAAKKMKAGLSVGLQNNKKRAVTLYMNNDDPRYHIEWCLKNQFTAEYVFISDYPQSTPDARPLGFGSIMNGLAGMFPKAAIGIGEYGGENADGDDELSPEQRVEMLVHFETRPRYFPNDVGGGFWWDAYKWLVSAPSPDITEALRKCWRPL